MFRTIRPFATLLAVAAVAVLGACAPEAAADPAPLPAPAGIGASTSAEDERFRDPKELAALLATGTPAAALDSWKGDFLLLDVRTASEFAAGRIPGALLQPYDRIASEPPAFPKDGLVIVYCRSGNRSAQAKATLMSLGWSRVVDFGGLSRWAGPLEK
ncbi:MAG: rhodanese-like domain-containing protein [Spirochaetales bacterium]|nr:rhodanese-like domain-containing protein [Spirochaetales bacterium]